MGQTFNASSIDTAVTTPAGLGTITKDALLTLQSQFSGASLPATNLVGGQIALDTTNNVYWRRDPANTKWMLHASAADALVVAKSGAYTAVLGDFGKTLVCTGSWTLGFSASAALTDGWWQRVVNAGSGTVTFDPNGAELINGASTFVLAPGDDCVVVCDGSGLRTLGHVAIVAQDFRLSLTTALPVTTSDVTGATTIYAVPKTGNRIGLYDGASWKNYTSAEFSLALGTLTAAKPYDVFCYQNAGVPTLEFLAWTNDTTRATALAYNNGILVKSGDATRRYLGSFYTTSTTTTEDSASSRYLYNYYHRAPRMLRRQESTASWTYTTATFRQANNAAANQVNFLQGVAEDSISARVAVELNNASAIAANVALVLDSVTAPAVTDVFVAKLTSATNELIGQGGVWTPQLGRHYLAWLEYSTATGTTTWRGANTNGTGIFGEVRA